MLLNLGGYYDSPEDKVHYNACQTNMEQSGGACRCDELDLDHADEAADFKRDMEREEEYDL